MILILNLFCLASFLLKIYWKILIFFRMLLKYFSGRILTKTNPAWIKGWRQKTVTTFFFPHDGNRKTQYFCKLRVRETFNVFNCWTLLYKIPHDGRIVIKLLFKFYWKLAFKIFWLKHLIFGNWKPKCSQSQTK